MTCSLPCGVVSSPTSCDMVNRPRQRQGKAVAKFRTVQNLQRPVANRSVANRPVVTVLDRNSVSSWLSVKSHERTVAQDRLLQYTRRVSDNQNKSVIGPVDQAFFINKLNRWIFYQALLFMSIHKI